MDTMNTEKRIEEKIDALVKHSKNAGFTNPPADYFEHFADNLPLQKSRGKQPVVFRKIRENWFQIGSLAVAAILFLALWIFVFDSNIKNEDDFSFTVDELTALNDFRNYDEDMLYSEMALFPEEQISNDAEVDVLLDLGSITIDEFIELSSTEDLK